MFPVLMESKYLLTSLHKQTNKNRLMDAKYKYRFPEGRKFSPRLLKSVCLVHSLFQRKWVTPLWHGGLFGSGGKGAPLSANQPNPEKETDSFLPNWSVSYSITPQKPWGPACRSGTDHIWGGMSVPSGRVLVCTYWSWLIQLRESHSLHWSPNENHTLIWKTALLHEEMVKIHNDHFMSTSFKSTTILLFCRILRCYKDSEQISNCSLAWAKLIDSSNISADKVFWQGSKGPFNETKRLHIIWKIQFGQFIAFTQIIDYKLNLQCCSL